jgi:pimeloyl-ACP methyl ester carboxylesterase
MSESMENHPNFKEEVVIEDGHFRKVVLDIAEKLPVGWNIVSEKTANGLHAIGCEIKGEAAKAAPTLIQIPGFCHKNTAFRKTWLLHARDGIQTMALTPPGIPPSAELARPIEKWGIEDYLEPLGEAVKEIAEKRDSLVIEGHSLGGLLALHICAQAEGIAGMRRNVKAWIGINSVKPPNVAQRMKPVEFPNGAEEFSFEKNPQFFSEWVNGLFGVSTEERIYEKLMMAHIENGSTANSNSALAEYKAALESRNKKIPKDFQWIMEDRKTCRGSRNMINDYAFGIWAIDQKKIQIPLFDINGELDKEDITGAKKETLTKDIIEPVSLHKDNAGLRRSIARFYSVGYEIRDFDENRKNAEEPMKKNWGAQTILRNGTHNSPIESEEHCVIVAELIRDFVNKVIGKNGSCQEFEVSYA